MLTTKNPKRVAAGKAAIRKRWGPTRIVRLDAVDPTVAAAIRALVAADEAARKEAASDVSTLTASSEVRGGGLDDSAA